MNRLRCVLVDVVITMAVVIAACTYFNIVHGELQMPSFVITGWVLLVVAVLGGRLLYPKLMSRRLEILRAGWHHLLVFLISTCYMIFFYIKLWLEGRIIIFEDIRFNKWWLLSILISVIAEAIIFWSGMLRVFFTSEQLAIKWRIIAAACGMIPVANIYVLVRMMIITGNEIKFEDNRLKVQAAREKDLCKTKYPLFMVHGIFFRDFEHLNYWGRVPKALEENGAEIYYGNHMSSSSVERSARELSDRLEEVCRKAGCEKVNVIAHSKGGLDMRYAISKLGADKYVASLTTINTPHRGCEFAEYLLNKIPQKQQELVAEKYDAIFRKLGDKDPDFMEGVSNLTFSFCDKFNEEVKDVDGILYESVGSKLNKATNGRFPLNMSHPLVKHFDGDNDGLVGERSFSWGSRFTYLTVKGKRGISHGDMIDLNRENIPGFDVREFYIGLVHDLAQRGY